MQAEQTVGVKHLLQWGILQRTQVWFTFSTNVELQIHFSPLNSKVGGHTQAPEETRNGGLQAAQTPSAEQDVQFLTKHEKHYPLRNVKPSGQTQTLFWSSKFLGHKHEPFTWIKLLAQVLQKLSAEQVVQ